MTIPTRPADLVNPRAGEQLWFETDETGTRIQGICPAHSPGPPMHRQMRTEENPTVVRGRIRYIVDGRVHELGPGDSVLIPPGAPHRFENPYDEEVEIDNLTRPRLVHEVGLRLLCAALARKRPNPLELAVAFHDGDNFPAFLPPRVAVALVTLLYSISKVTGVANRFRQAVLPASLA
jgi:mannose-6-phosphate isomerase-like protein (cupin superfamily)